MQKKKPQVSGVVVPQTPSFKGKVLAFVVFVLLSALLKTLRFTWTDPYQVFTKKSKTPVIFCLWHNRLATSVQIGAILRKRYEISFAGLVSASKDGGFLSEILRRFQVIPVRGSSSRRGRQALLEMTSRLENNINAVITPDGPRGPLYQIQEGVIGLAQLTGAPIIPTTLNLQWKVSLKSWDRFQIPLPFSKCEILYGAPIVVSRDAGDAERETKLAELKAAMAAITRD